MAGFQIKFLFYGVSKTADQMIRNDGIYQYVMQNIEKEDVFGDQFRVVVRQHSPSISGYDIDVVILKLKEKKIDFIKNRELYDQCQRHSQNESQLLQAMEEMRINNQRRDLRDRERDQRDKERDQRDFQRDQRDLDRDRKFDSLTNAMNHLMSDNQKLMLELQKERQLNQKLVKYITEKENRDSN